MGFSFPNLWDFYSRTYGIFIPELVKQAQGIAPLHKHGNLLPTPTSVSKSISKQTSIILFGTMQKMCKFTIEKQ